MNNFARILIKKIMRSLKFIPVLLLLMPFFTRAQFTIDSVATYQTISDDSLFYGETLTMDVRVLYQSPTPFTGTIYLLGAVDTSLGIMSIDTMDIVPVVNLANDSVMMNFSEVVLPQEDYKLGGNIVVVWPVAETKATLDSFRTNIYVISPLTEVAENKDLYSEVLIAPNPFQNEINVKILNNNIDFDYVRIYTFEGKRVLSSAYFSRKINVAPLPKGFYIIELITKKGERLRYKLVKNGTANSR